MGQKVQPIGFRLGYTEDWRSRWFAKKADYGKYLLEDHKIRGFIKKEYHNAGVPKIEIERKPEGDEVTVIIHSARPGIIIGRKGAKVDKLKDHLGEITGKKIDLKINEINRAELNGQLVAESVAEQLEKRASFRRVVKKAVELTMQAGALGCKIQVAGRLGGAEMSRREHTHRGSIPLHTLDAHICYGQAEARTTHGTIGIKCWVYRGNKTSKESFDASAAKKG
jgi:small subunit ribosomal protein S3